MKVTFKGTPIALEGYFPAKGDAAPDFIGRGSAKVHVKKG